MGTAFLRVALCVSVLWGTAAAASVVPPDVADRLRVKSIVEFSAADERRFNELIDPVVAAFQATVEAYGGTMTKEANWDSDIVNATAYVIGNEWRIVAFGGLYRVDGMTDDGFQLAICHEAGHLLGGFPFYAGSIKATSEGQADYFGAQVCASRIWRDQMDANRAAYVRAPQSVKDACDQVWSDVAAAELCARIAVTGEDLINGLSSDLNVSVDTPDDTVRPATLFSSYPDPQCRVDTYFRGALCDTDWDFSLIPGRRAAVVNGVEAEAEAHQYSCHLAKAAVASRPACWYSQRVDLP